MPPGYFKEEIDLISAFAVGGFQHFHQGIDGFKQFKAAIRYLISHHGIVHVYLINKTLIHKVFKVFLYLAIAHVGGIHYFRLAGAVFADSQHIGDYLDVGTALTHGWALPGFAAQRLFAI